MHEAIRNPAATNRHNGPVEVAELPDEVFRSSGLACAAVTMAIA
jgi:hypothetical protein